MAVLTFPCSNSTSVALLISVDITPALGNFSVYGPRNGGPNSHNDGPGNSIPEPSTVLLIGLGGLWLTFLLYWGVYSIGAGGAESTDLVPIG